MKINKKILIGLTGASVILATSVAIRNDFFPFISACIWCFTAFYTILKLVK
jgi:hypothetical protein